MAKTQQRKAKPLEDVVILVPHANGITEVSAKGVRAKGDIWLPNGQFCEVFGFTCGVVNPWITNCIFLDRKLRTKNDYVVLTSGQPRDCLLYSTSDGVDITNVYIDSRRKRETFSDDADWPTASEAAKIHNSTRHLVQFWGQQGLVETRKGFRDSGNGPKPKLEYKPSDLTAQFGVRKGDIELTGPDPSLLLEDGDEWIELVATAVPQFRISKESIHAYKDRSLRPLDRPLQHCIAPGLIPQKRSKAKYTSLDYNVEQRQTLVTYVSRNDMKRIVEYRQLDPSDPNMMPLREAAEECGTTVKRVDRLIEAKELSFEVLPWKYPRFRRDVRQIHVDALAAALRGEKWTPPKAETEPEPASQISTANLGGAPKKKRRNKVIRDRFKQAGFVNEFSELADMLNDDNEFKKEFGKVTNEIIRKVIKPQRKQAEKTPDSFPRQVKLGE